jgi:DNA polymerase elongation subunit (family B)
MPQLRLQNIHNHDRTIYLFERLDDGNLKITKDESFYPYYYEPDPAGKYKSYDGQPLTLVTVSKPSEVAVHRSKRAYEADILYPKRYLLDRVDTIIKSPLKYVFFDIEICTGELPDVTKATKPISCITVWSSSTGKYMTWFLPEWAMDETAMLDDFIDWMQQESPDLILAWNVDFDYPYIYNRYKKLKPKANMASAISPVQMCRMGRKGALHPAGVSIVDYMGLYQKVTLGRLKSYALDYVAQQEFNESAWGHTDINDMSAEVKSKNANDVRRMVDIESKRRILPHFDEIRRFSKCYWEDLPNEHVIRDGKKMIVSNNSKVIDMIVLDEARKMGIVLPSKSDDSEKEEFEGAYRETLESGMFHDLGKYDLSGAYLKPIMDLCLDSANIVDESIYSIDPSVVAVNVTDRATRVVKTVHFVRQDPNALMPRVVRRLFEEREKLRSQMKSMDQNDPQYSDIEQKYKAMKSLVLSFYGVIAMQFFRLYDARIAAMITSVVRDLLHYVQEKVQRGP